MSDSVFIAGVIVLFSIVAACCLYLAGEMLSERREREASRMDVCANCGFPYAHHMQNTQCFPESETKWFPKLVADALEKQQRRIRKAQRDLVK